CEILGPSIDIHGGGLDQMIPHHENELAQSESANDSTFVRYRMHNGLMQSGKQSGKVGGQHDRHGDAVTDHEAQVAGKLAGSAGAESVKTAVFAHHHPEAVRFFLLSTHYRSPIDFSLENIAATEKGLDSFYRMFESLERITGTSFYKLLTPTLRSETTSLDGLPHDFAAELSELRERFLEAMDDDFNTGGAIGTLFEMRRVINGYITSNKLEDSADDTQKAALTKAATLFRELATVLGVFRAPVQKAAGADDEFVNGLMNLILDIRAHARAEKNWDVADKIRDALADLEVTIEDGRDGARWSRD
ncbi:MAG: DALR domain-containing protein, partial [Maioricimonas sp. JB049]